jgi:hypothetical protein
MGATFKTADFMKLTTGIFNYSFVQSSDIPDTVFGFVLSPNELKLESVELFTVNAVNNHKTSTLMFTFNSFAVRG